MTAFDYIENHHWHVFDEKHNPHQDSGNSALAYQDSFLRYVPFLNQNQSSKNNAILHFYPLQKEAILLGSKDTRLKDVFSANQFLVDSGYDVLLRPHGGLAVVNEPGILNVGLVSDNQRYPLSIDLAYEQMVQLVQQSLSQWNIKVESYEIPDSYCPGRYDLVIDGLKIGGIAQRRFKTGITTAAYISVNGDQDARAELIRDYYLIGQGDETYPKVNPNVMTTLEKVIGEAITVSDYQRYLLEVFKRFSTVEVGDFNQTDLEGFYQQSFPKVFQRTLSVQP
ncbi:lipoate--protein ligase family protein [Fundicoccus sp. Sow4_H7]|uniref:lipoate--protein ligase family protein n=1 Tax=Fundicoccus sp. Sow4_H7 TaxID=3438784 RepID=UPI003F901820